MKRHDKSGETVSPGIKSARKLLTARILPVALMLTLLLPLALAGCASVPTRKLYPGSDALLPGTRPEMNTPGFWISRNPAPDQAILDDNGIAAFNREVVARRLVRDLETWEPPDSVTLAKEIDGTIAWIAGIKVYGTDGRRVSERFLSPIRKLVAEMELPQGAGDGARVLYGFLVRKTDLRVLPTSDPLFDGPGDPYIDNLQASSLEAGTALVIQATTKDGEWIYVTTEKTSGWIPKSSAATTTPEAFLERYRASGALTVIDTKADLWLDPGQTRFACSVRMGSRLLPATTEDPVAESPAENTAEIPAENPAEVPAKKPAGSSVIAVSMPERDEDGTLVERTLWVKAGSVTQGVLPCTPRTVYEEAFKQLDAPYGWGGSFGEQDCSQFLCEVFATMGITLPRNSSKQAKSGVSLKAFAAIPGTDGIARAGYIVDHAPPSATLLRFPGHIMLYLGSVDGVPFAIHATFGYRENEPSCIQGFSRERIRLINRVVVSNLELGKGTSVGSHLSRLTDLALIANEAGSEATIADAPIPAADEQ